MSAPPVQRTVDVGGVALTFLEYGDPGAPLALCLHGFPDSPIGFRHLARHLAAAGYHVVTPWLRGYPPSPPVEGSYQVAALAHDVIGLTLALSPDRPALVVGHDWGGLATYGAGVLAPERFTAAVVMAVAPTAAFRDFLRHDWDQQRAAWYQFLFQMEHLAEAIVSHDDFAYLDRLWSSWSPGWSPDAEALEAARASIRDGFPASLLYYRDTWQPDRQDPALAADQQRIAEGPLTVPTLVLHGLQDGCILPGAFANTGPYFSGPHRIESRPGVGHFLHLEDPDGIAERILAFVSPMRGSASPHETFEEG